VSDDKPRALRLAQILSDDADEHDLIAQEAAAELRRLHALCKEMGDALEASDEQLMLEGLRPDGPTRKHVLAALAKWKESQ